MGATLNMEKTMFSFFQIDEEHDDDQTLVSNTSPQDTEMGEVREENQKLKHALSRVLKDYNSLQMHFNDFFQQEVPKSCEKLVTDQEGDGNELISLSLGTISSNKQKDSPKKANCFNKKKDGDDEQELKLGLGCEFDMKKDEYMPNSEPQVHSLKSGRREENDLIDQIPLKKARVSVKVVCDTQTMNDGCQWRKYGQKIAKGNPCPRAYYRCTLSPSCPVRKHVQRCANDRSVLITTYEGTHNHPLSASATAMASTTSAAASMLKSPSSTSQPGLTTTVATYSTTTLSGHHGMTYNSMSPNQYPFYLPNTTISTYQSHPTITLDLTSNPYFNRSTSTNFLRTHPRFSSSSSINFSCPSPSSSSSSPMESNYKNHIKYSYLGNQTPKEAFFQNPSHDNFKNNSTSSSSQNQPPESIAAAAKALTSNPSFKSVLAASITSLVRNVEDRART